MCAVFSRSFDPDGGIVVHTVDPLSLRVVAKHNVLSTDNVAADSEDESKGESKHLSLKVSVSAKGFRAILKLLLRSCVLVPHTTLFLGSGQEIWP